MPALLGFGYLVAGIIVAISILSSAIKIVREYQRLVVFRLGRSIGKQGPGVVFLLPVIDRAVWVELREILPPREVQEAMTRQMSAERSRRAVVTEALGNREAAVTVAEGQKQAAILKAEGDRQAAILRAEGFSLALDKIFSVAKNIDSKTLTLQYLEALKSLGEGAATKFIFPLEFTKLLQPLSDYAREAGEQK